MGLSAGRIEALRCELEETSQSSTRGAKMSNLMITIALLLTAGAVFFSQRASITNVRHVNTQLTSQSNTLRARTAQLEQRQEDLQRRLNESQDRLDRLRQEQAKVPAPTP